MSHRPIRRPELAITAFFALLLGAGPTVGDVGACGKVASDLDVPAFASRRKKADCDRCTSCHIQTSRCKRACAKDAPGDLFLPDTCRPLAHDGDVCIRALRASSCGDYEGFMDDAEPGTPPECDFCHSVPAEAEAEKGVIPP